MITGMMIVGGLVLAVFFCVLWAINRYNVFIQLKTLLDEAWSGIDVQLKRRCDLIPNLVSVVKGYSIHEKEVLEEVTRLRTVTMAATDIKAKSVAEGQLAQTLKTLFAVAEQYPQLKANENFLELQKELGLIEQEVQLARRYYNGTVRNYNTAVMQFPSSLIARFFSFVVAPYFELSDVKERDITKIQF